MAQPLATRVTLPVVVGVLLGNVARTDVAIKVLQPTPISATRLTIAEARELVDMLAGVGRHDQVAQFRLGRFLRARGYEVEADRLSA